MSEHSNIQWTDSTWPVVAGCDYASPGCANCYAVRDSWRMSFNPNPKVSGAYAGAVAKNEVGKLRWTGLVRSLPQRLDWPLRWKSPRRVFVCNMADLFHEDVPDEFICKVFTIMRRISQHIFQVLTKRPERMMDFMQRLCWYAYREEDTGLWAYGWQAYVGASKSHGYIPPNIWLGTSIESERYAYRAVYLRATPAAIRFISAEPLLGRLSNLDLEGIDWVFVGGESGAKARVMHPDWLEMIVWRCREVGIAVFVKQLGPVWAKGHGADSHGGDMSFWPQDLRVREFPA